jgi:hypothetical protein
MRRHPMNEEKSNIRNTYQFMEKHLNRNVKVYMRKDKQSGDIPAIIEGTLGTFDTGNNVIIVNTKDKHYILCNRGSIAFIEIKRGEK